MKHAAWVQERDLSASKPRLFCLPHAGSGSAGYYRWKRLMLSAGVCPIHLPGRDLQRERPAISDGNTLVAELDEGMKDRLERPYAVFGHSMGALLAFAWTQRIQAAGLPLPLAVFLSGRAPRRRPGVTAAAWLQADDDTLLQSLDTRFGGNSAAMLQDPDVRAAFLPVLRADLHVVESLQTGGEPLRVPIYALCGDADGSVNQAEMQAWHPYAAAGFESATFPGGHFYNLGEGEAALLHWLDHRLGHMAASTSPTSDTRS